MRRPVRLIEHEPVCPKPRLSVPGQHVTPYGYLLAAPNAAWRMALALRTELIALQHAGGELQPPALGHCPARGAGAARLRLG